jgi:hypothetical protein
MLKLPESGFKPYQNGEHQTDLSVFCDWLEGSLLFTKKERVSISAIKDILTEEYLYAQQDNANEFLAFAWREFGRRKSALGSTYPIDIRQDHITRAATWRQSTPYAFCLLLSFAARYKAWAMSFGTDYTEQGLLFEQVTAEALLSELDGWTVHPTGWSTATATRLKQIVSEVQAILGEGAGDLTKFPRYQTAKDAGLDVVLFRSFNDNRIGYPTYLIQCASGVRWESKRHQPNINEWKTFIDFAALPKKALAIPFALRDDEFWWACRNIDGMLLDRVRLLSAGRRKPNWISTTVRREVVAWMAPRVQTLPLHRI